MVVNREGKIETDKEQMVIADMVWYLLMYPVTQPCWEETIGSQIPLGSVLRQDTFS